MSKRITKVRFKSPVVEIHTEEHLGTSVKESVFKCTEEPHPDFRVAFDRLTRHVFEILDLPAGAWPGAMKITGVTFSKSEDTGVEGAVITGVVDLETSHSPFCFNTPHLPFSAYSEGSEAPTMPTDAVEDLELLRAEAAVYMDGSKRAQLNLLKS